MSQVSRSVAGWNSAPPASSPEKICLFLIGAFALKNLFVYLNQILIFRIQSKTAKKLRDDVFARIIEMPLGYFHRNRVGNLMKLPDKSTTAMESCCMGPFLGGREWPNDVPNATDSRSGWPISNRRTENSQPSAMNDSADSPFPLEIAVDRVPE
jgi:hypothetical protein